jgi:26S proteasome non-ATPase regulatory subunit 10
MIAASIGHDALLDLFLEAGADVNKQNETGQTALHYAASRNRQQVSTGQMDGDVACR